MNESNQPEKKKRGRPKGPSQVLDRLIAAGPHKYKKKTYVNIPVISDNTQIIDHNLVMQLASEDCTALEICAYLKINKDRLYKECGESLRMGRDLGNASIKRKMYELAMAGDVKLLIWLSKNRLGYREQPIEELQDTTLNVIIQDVPTSDKYKVLENGRIIDTDTRRLVMHEIAPDAVREESVEKIKQKREEKNGQRDGQSDQKDPEGRKRSKREQEPSRTERSEERRKEERKVN